MGSDPVVAVFFSSVSKGTQRSGIETVLRRCLWHQVNSLGWSPDGQLSIDGDLPTKEWLRYFSAPKVDVIRTDSWLIRDAGGNRTHFHCFAGSCLAIWLPRHRMCKKKSFLVGLPGSRFVSLLVLRLVARPGMEPGPTASEAVMRSNTPTGQVVSTPTWSRTRTKTLGEPCAVHYTIGTVVILRADDWIRTSMIRFTRPAPFCVEPRRQEGVSEGSRTLTFCFTGRRAYHVHYGHHVFPSGRCGGILLPSNPASGSQVLCIATCNPRRYGFLPLILFSGDDGI